MRTLWGGLLLSILPALAFAASPDSLAAPANEADLERWEGIPVGRIYCTGNKRTKEGVVLQEMLLEPGKPFNSALAEESLRNLRALPFLSEARMLAHPEEDGSDVDLEIQVKDSFPWFGAVVPNLAGGKSELLFVAGNGNFRGTGQTTILYVFLSNEVENSAAGYFREPRLFGSRWGGELSLGYQGEAGPRNRITLNRPLYSLSSRWGFSGSAFDEAEERLLYESGLEASDFYAQRTGAAVGAARSFRDRDRRLELDLTYSFVNEEYRQVEGWTGVIPADKRRATLNLEPSLEFFRFVRDRFFKAMGPTEDLRLGFKGSLRAGGALEALGSDRNYPVLGAGLRWFQGRPGTGYLLAEATVDTRIESGEFLNTSATSTVAAYGRLPGDGLLAWRAQFTWLQSMEDPQQLLLDSPNGLRGYEANSHEGQRRYLTNLEWRQPWWRPGSVVLGSAVFADAGIIGSPARPIHDQPVLVGAGAGIRLGFSGLLGAPVIRLDVAYGFEPETWETSFGFGQRF
jgi:Surface antigen variable number repeat